MIVDEFTVPEALFILKEGTVRVEKSVNMQNQNYWPVHSNRWEVVKTQRTVNRHLFNIPHSNFFAEKELIK